jgi:hypothetical protein
LTGSQSFSLSFPRIEQERPIKNRCPGIRGRFREEKIFLLFVPTKRTKNLLPCAWRSRGEGMSQTVIARTLFYGISLPSTGA